MTPNPTPPVSPTGQAVVSQVLTRIALIVFGVAGAIALAPTAGIDVSFLPPIVPKVCAFVAFIAATMGFAGPGIRKAAPMVLLCVGIGLSSCAHVDPLVLTGDSLDLVEHSVVVTRDALAQASQQKRISQAVVDGWNHDFYPRYLATYHTACDTWRSAKSSADATKQQQAAAIISTITSDLARYSSLVMLAPMAMDGGAP